MKATIVIPVFNQVDYTRRCLESLNAAGYDNSMIIAINNGSTDGTAEFLASRPALRVITNPENRACAAAWNQGFHASATYWTLFLNNDVVVPCGWLERLVQFAENFGVDIASPAMGEGEFHYHLGDYAREFTEVMARTQRRGTAQGAAFLVSRAVFETIGGFDENFHKCGFEDDDFFLRARRSGFKLAVTGRAYVHHFGGVTQRALVAENGSQREEVFSYFRQKWKLNWPRRRWRRLRRKAREIWWRVSERLGHGHTLREWRVNGKILYR